MTPALSAVEQDGVGLDEEAAGRSLEEYQREAAGSGARRARGRRCFEKVSVDVTLKLEEAAWDQRGLLGCAASLLTGD